MIFLAVSSIPFLKCYVAVMEVSNPMDILKSYGKYEGISIMMPTLLVLCDKDKDLQKSYRFY